MFDHSSIDRILVEIMKRVYEALIREHLSINRQMLFISGPRQVGKTTLSMSLDKPKHYFSLKSAVEKACREDKVQVS